MAKFFVQDVYRITGIGTIPVGRVVNGILRTGMKASIDGAMIEIKAIEKNHEQIKEAQTGDNVGLNIKIMSRGLNQNVSFFKKLFGASDIGYDILKKYVKKTIEFI